MQIYRTCAHYVSVPRYRVAEECATSAHGVRSQALAARLNEIRTHSDRELNKMRPKMSMRIVGGGILRGCIVWTE